MDGIHDLGGKPGYGKVEKKESHAVFHKRWEAAVFAMVNASARAGAFQNIDRFRHAIERVNPEAYLHHGYYGRWLGAIENLLVEAGSINQSELNQRALEGGASDVDLIAAQPSDHPDSMGPPSTETGSRRELKAEPRFSVGDRVRSRGVSVPGHTRLPEYARGKSGLILVCHQGWVFPDTNAHGLGEQPKHLYTVRFRSEDLWGKVGFAVNLDLFEPYLEKISYE
tara:strand:- start:144 stop:818 length:675 start_codon:yes stop_codon:yes gene_type:complete